MEKYYEWYNLIFYYLPFDTIYSHHLSTVRIYQGFDSFIDLIVLLNGRKCVNLITRQAAGKLYEWEFSSLLN